MEKETRGFILDIIKQVFSFIAFIAFLAFLHYAVCSGKANAEIKPQYGNWICWYNSVYDDSCGTFGYSKQKKVAKKVAEEKCANHCESACKLEYCEIIKKD
jgi:hypothetical protein